MYIQQRHSTPYTRICVTIIHVYTAETGYSLQRNLHRKAALAYSRHAMAYTRIRVARIHVYTAETCLELTPETASQECMCIQ